MRHTYLACYCQHPPFGTLWMLLIPAGLRLSLIPESHTFLHYPLFKKARVCAHIHWYCVLISTLKTLAICTLFKVSRDVQHSPIPSPFFTSILLMYLCACVVQTHEGACRDWMREGISVLWGCVNGGLLGLGAGDQTWVLCKCSLTTELSPAARCLVLSFPLDDIFQHQLRGHCTQSISLPHS